MTLLQDRPARQTQESRSLGYTQIPNAVHALKLPWRVEMLVTRLMQHRWEPGATVTIFIRTLADEMNCSTRTVDRAIADAVEMGLLVVTHNQWAGKSLGPSSYYLTAAVTTVYMLDGQCHDVAASRPTPREVATPVAQKENRPRQQTQRTGKTGMYQAPRSYLETRQGTLAPR